MTDTGSGAANPRARYTHSYIVTDEGHLRLERLHYALYALAVLTEPVVSGNNELHTSDLSPLLHVLADEAEAAIRSALVDPRDVA